MGANTLGSLMKRAATTSGLTNKRLTNHSVRKTCVTTLSKAGVAPNKIIQVTGHKSLASIACKLNFYNPIKYHTDCTYKFAH